jgi:hypothetical protein
MDAPFASPAPLLPSALAFPPVLVAGQSASAQSPWLAGATRSSTSGCPVVSGTDVLTRRWLVACVAWRGMAGHDTTTALLGWALMEVAARPEIQARLTAEVLMVVGDDDEVRASGWPHAHSN